MRMALKENELSCSASEGAESNLSQSRDDRRDEEGRNHGYPQGRALARPPHLKRIGIGVWLVLLPATRSFAQLPQSVICTFERIATAELDSGGKVISGGETSKGEMVISNLNSDAPVASGNIGAVKLQVLKRSKDTIWLAEITANEVGGFITWLTSSSFPHRRQLDFPIADVRSSVVSSFSSPSLLEKHVGSPRPECFSNGSTSAVAHVVASAGWLSALPRRPALASSSRMLGPAISKMIA
jgi:hypothetical protein